MSIRLDDVNGLSSATQRAMRLARRLGGYVVSVQYGSEGNRNGNAYLTLRVPVARVQTAVVQLSGLGTILSQNVAITDVQPKVNALERTIVRLTSDISAVDAQLKSPSLTQAERTRLEFRRERLATARRDAVTARTATINRASFATVRLDLTTQKRQQPAAPAGRFTRTIDKAGGILAAEAAWTLLVLAIALPFLLIVALLLWGVRAARRASDRRLLESG
jgi:ABC-type anion transport system duplicated permease subunit